MNILKRFSKPLPELFKKLRNAGLILITAGSAILASQWEGTQRLADFAGYMTLAGGVLAAVSQLTVKDQNRSIKQHHE